ncbi:MAG: hypothetical protein REH79_02220 [Spiroplasma sp.]|nr:hypothetical protein [Spiroplasma sp.]
MKKLLSLFMQTIFISSFSFSISACYNPFSNTGNTGNGGDNGETKPPITKDIEYYQKLIDQTQIDVNNCREWLDQIEEDWANDKITEDDYNLLFDEVSAGLYTYQSEINEYQYQILLLEKKDDKFTLEQIIKGLTIITEKITNLKQALILEIKHPNDYPETEIEKLKNALKEALEIEQILLKLKEEEENKCDN